MNEAPVFVTQVQRLSIPKSIPSTFSLSYIGISSPSKKLAFDV